MTKLILLSLLMTLGLSQTLHAQIYKWTDSEGKVHYSSTPPKDTKSKAENIEDKIKFNIGKVQPATTHHVAPKSTENKNEPLKEKPTKTKSEKPSSKAKVAYCNGLRRNIQTLKHSKNVNIAEEGNLKPLSSSEKTARLAKEKSTFEKNCSDL